MTKSITLICLIASIGIGIGSYVLNDTNGILLGVLLLVGVNAINNKTQDIYVEFTPEEEE